MVAEKRLIVRLSLQQRSTPNILWLLNCEVQVKYPHCTAVDIVRTLLWPEEAGDAAVVMSVSTSSDHLGADVMKSACSSGRTHSILKTLRPVS